MSIERRAAVELRAGGDKSSPRLHGYAAVFDSDSVDLGGFVERIAPGAFRRSLTSNTADPVAMVAHMPHVVLGRRSAGTLRLHEDQRGLAFEVDLPPTQAAKDLLVSVERGDMRSASFGFNVAPNGDKWEVRGNQVVRTLTDVDLIEVTVCSNPAYTDTTVARRAFVARHLPDAKHLRLAKLWLESA